MTKNDAPPGLLAVYDNRGRSQDRYTAVFVPHKDESDGRLWWPLFVCCGDPASAYGIGITGSTPTRRTRATWEREIQFSQLPDGARQSIAAQAAEWLEVAADHT